MKNSEEFFDKFRGDEDLFSDDENAKDNTDNNFDWAPKIISSVSTADDPWYESIRTKCEVCSEILWHGQFIKHIRLTHSMGLKDYKKVHSNSVMELPNYQCLICYQFVAHYSSPISGHLTSKHGITLPEYYDKYEKDRDKTDSSNISYLLETKVKIETDIESDCKPQMPKSEVKESPDCQFSNPEQNPEGQPPCDEVMPISVQNASNEEYMETEFDMDVKDSQFASNDQVINTPAPGPSSPTSLLVLSPYVQVPLQTPEKSNFYVCENSDESLSGSKTMSKTENQRLFLTPKEKYAKEVSALSDNNQSQLSFDLSQVFETKEQEHTVGPIETQEKNSSETKPKNKIPLAFKIWNAKKKMDSQKKHILGHGDVRLNQKQKLKTMPPRKRVQKKFKANFIFHKKSIDEKSNILHEDVPLSKRIVNKKKQVPGTT